MSDRQPPVALPAQPATPETMPPPASAGVLSLWRERLLDYLLRGAALVGLIAWAGNSFADVQNGDWADLAVISVIYGLVLVIAFTRLPFRLRAGLTILLVYALMLNSLRSAGIRGDAQLFGILITVLALMLFSARAGWIMLGITVLTVAGAAWATVTGHLTVGTPYDQLNPSVWLPLVAVMVLVTSLIMLGLILLQREFLAAQERERKALQAMTQDRELMELRIAERTRALETSVQISRRLSTLLDESQIVTEVIEQLRTAYNYYHVHIYLFDAAREYLVMAGGTGEAGRTLRARGHRLTTGQGLVGRAAATNTVVFVADVSQATGWLPNPLLPDTRSEVAVPIALGDRVLGVLDVQQNAAGSLQPAEGELIQAVAQQAAIALQNARSFAKAQREAQAEVLIRHITHEIQSAATAPAALQVAVRELGQALGAERVRARLAVSQSEPDTGAAGRTSTP